MKKRYPLPGEIWQHYKGGVYESLTMAVHTETGEQLVIYRSVPFGSVHARPLDQWDDSVENLDPGGDEWISRFTLMQSSFPSAELEN